MLHIPYSNVFQKGETKGFAIAERAVLITNSDIAVQHAEGSSAVTLPIAYNCKPIHLVTAKINNSAEWMFFVYAYNAESAEKITKDFVLSCGIGGALFSNDIVVVKKYMLKEANK